MGILEYLLGPKDREPHDVQPHRAPVPVPMSTTAAPRPKQRRIFVVSKARTIRRLTASRGVGDDPPLHA